MSADLKKLWESLGDLTKTVDRAESIVQRWRKRRRSEGRETPFFGRLQLVFPMFSQEVQTAPLVHAQGRTTRVVLLTHSVDSDWLKNLPGVALGDPAAASTTGVGTVAMRPTPRCYIGPASQTNNDLVDNQIFDFEWNCSIGSTQREYGTSRAPFKGTTWMSRRSLGNPEVDYQLSMSSRHAITLKTNEALIFRARPILWLPHDNLDADMVNASIRLNITYAAYRTHDGNQHL